MPAGGGGGGGGGQAPIAVPAETEPPPTNKSEPAAEPKAPSAAESTGAKAPKVCPNYLIGTYSSHKRLFCLKLLLLIVGLSKYFIDMFHLIGMHLSKRLLHHRLM